MGTSAVFGTAVFGQAVFGDTGGGTTTTAILEKYTSLSGFKTGAETITDTKFLAALTFRERGTNMDKLITIQKG